MTKKTRPSVRFVALRYYPSVRATAQHLADLAEGLVRRGYAVEVLCGAEDDVPDAPKLPKTELHNGVRIRRVRTTGFNRASTLGRAVNTLSFYGSIFFALVFGPKCDLLVMLTAPPMAGLMGAFARKLRGQRFGVWSLDLHPEAEIAVGMLREDGAAARFLRRVDRYVLRRADFVVDLGRCMRQRLLDKGVPPERLTTIPVWSKKEDIEPVPPEANPLPDRLGLRGRFVVMYSGNAGILHRFEEVLEVMRRLRDRREIVFLFVGGGVRRKEIEAYAQKHALPNFRYLDYFPRDRIKYSLSMADVHLITLKTRAAGIAVPSKLYGAMAAARPLIMVGPEASEISLTIREVGCGYVIDPERVADPTTVLEEAVLSLYENRALARAQGARGREAFLRHYECAVAVDQWKTLLDGLLALGEAPESVAAEQP